LGALVVAGDVVLDRGDQFGDVVVDAAADLLAGEDREPDLDHVHPGGACWGEVEVHALVALEPALDLGGGVGGGVVENDVERAARVGAHEPVEEGEELLVAVARVAGAGDLAAGDLERRVEAGRKAVSGRADGKPLWRDRIELNCTYFWLEMVGSVARSAREVREKCESRSCDGKCDEVRLEWRLIRLG
jgi:hypothetical protein